MSPHEWLRDHSALMSLRICRKVDVLVVMGVRPPQSQATLLCDHTIGAQHVRVSLAWQSGALI